MTAHRFDPREVDAVCLRCRSISRADWWYDRDAAGVVRPCPGVEPA